MVDKHPQIITHQHFAHLQMTSEVYTHQSEYINQLALLLSEGKPEEAEKLYREHLSFEEYPTFFTELEQAKKIYRLNSFKSKLKQELSQIEGELAIDVETHLNYGDRPYFRRVETSNANFYVTRSSNYGLSTFALKGKFARHLPWNHQMARSVLSTEINQVSEHGLVSLIGNYEPEAHNLKSVTYLTAQGRHYFEDAVHSLTIEDTTTQRDSGKIDVDNFMQMKEVIPTASQMRAIYASGNHIIDGPAGTGKSTSILQKILVLVNDEKISPNQIMVMVKHQGLVAPFKGLLSQMGIEGVEIIAVSDFLASQIGSNYQNLTQGNIDELVSISETLRDFLKKLKPKAKHSHMVTLPDCLDDGTLFELLKEHNAIQFDGEHLRARKEKREQELRKPFDVELEQRLSNKRAELSNLSNRDEFHHNFGMSDDDKEKLHQAKRKYSSLVDLRDMSDEEERVQYDTLIANLENKTFELEKRIKGRINHKGQLKVLHDLIEKRINDQLEDYELAEKNRIDNARRNEINNDLELNQIKRGLQQHQASLENVYGKIERATPESVIGYQDAESKTLLRTLAIREVKVLNTIIIDEAQDIPSVDIELVGFFTQQLILSGDEAQNENPDGVGSWLNLRHESGFVNKGQLSLHKLKHNFRQTYELGNLSYNFRQLMLGLEIEDLKEEYFENQKGFDKPTVTNKSLSAEVSRKLEYIQNHFIQKLPLVIIFEQQNETRMRLLIKELILSGLSVSVRQLKDHCDVCFLQAEQVAGKEFPVVISVVDEHTEDSTLYIMLSRAKFNLTVMVPKQSAVNGKLKTLAKHGIVTIE
ncbi:hypothetical protein [Photobacterium rosenbergii]|uniref:hypothetical protein n=1 Tax=Photobacterium rosenbergii TaxID=294936 RepID=UPI0011B28877|nr:hypothetical protein [Photobacterium rosenbergii]